MQQRSGFVDIVAWIFVVLAGFGVLIGTLQNLMVHLVFPSDLYERMARHVEGMPAAFEIFRYMDVIVAAMLALMIVALTAAIGLLRRWNWARLTFIGLMLAGVLWNVANVVWQWYFMEQFMPAVAAGAVTEDFGARFLMMERTVMTVMTLLTVALTVLFAWIAWKFTRPAIRAEFG